MVPPKRTCRTTYLYYKFPCSYPHFPCNQDLTPSLSFTLLQAMRDLAFFGKKLQQLCNTFSSFKLTMFNISCSCTSNACFLLSRLFSLLLTHLNPFLFQLCYFLSSSVLGFWVLKALKPRTQFWPRDLDLLFTSVSASTVSSMSTVEMEVFSNAQLLVLALLMFGGGEVFTSMVGLHLKASKLKKQWRVDTAVVEPINSISNTNNDDSKGLAVPPTMFYGRRDHVKIELVTISTSTDDSNLDRSIDVNTSDFLMTYRSLKFLGFVVLGYLLVVHFLGASSIMVYFSVVSTAKQVLRKKGLDTITFGVFTTVSTFANCGFIPTNENMIVFNKNKGLLLLLLPQILLGNTLFPPCLRLAVWILTKLTRSAKSYYDPDFLLKKTKEVGYHHLLPSRGSWILAATVFGLIFVQFVMFCAMEWDSETLIGMSTSQKLIAVLFQCVNSRHSGENIVDLSALSSAILVLFVSMMLVPSLSLFLFFFFGISISLDKIMYGSNLNL